MVFVSTYNNINTLKYSFIEKITQEKTNKAQYDNKTFLHTT